MLVDFLVFLFVVVAVYLHLCVSLDGDIRN